jgi:hypothetical protein
MLKPAQSFGLADERAQVYTELEKGADPGKLARRLAAKHPEEEAIVSFVDTVLAEVWLDSGAPFSDVLTVLEVLHRFDLPTGACRAYAVGILVAYAFSCADNSDPISDPKEAHYAVA